MEKKQLNTKEMSKKIFDLIEFIEQETGISYKGKTIKEAEIYIRKNKDKVPSSGSFNMWSLVND